MAFTARNLIQFLPAGMQKVARRIDTLWSVGALSEPLELVRQWRHRAAFTRLQKALFYHRWATAVLLAHDLGIYDLLYATPQSPRTVSDATGIHNRSADALLRILESQGHALRSDDAYELSPFGRMYLAQESPHSVAPMLDLMTAQAAAFAELPEGMREGATPAALDIFSAAGRYRAFLGAVNRYLDWAGRDLLANVSLPDTIRSIIVGSMGVSFSALLLQRFPEARVTYGCLPHLVREIPRLQEEYDVPARRVDGTHDHGGDPLEDTWGDEAFDLVFLTKKMILGPEDKLGEAFACKAFQVLRPGGVSIFWETVHTDDRPTPLPRAMEAVLDLGASPTGLVNTEGGLRRTLGAIGYRQIEIVPCLAGQTTFVVARRPE